MENRKGIKRFFHILAIYGCIATGILYVSVGIVAILSFLKLKEGGADESSLLYFLNDYLAGKILIWLVLLGTLSYVIWRIYEAISDPYDYGKRIGGLAKRTGIALSTIADMFIAYSAIQVLLGIGNLRADGVPEAERDMVSNLLNESGGQGIVITAGAIVMIVAFVQFIYGITRGYKERLDIAHFGSFTKNMIHFLAWFGYLARGVIIGIIGFFIIKAGIMKNGQFIVNTDKSFDFIGDHVGHLFFILFAVGTICYGIFMFSLAATYDSDKD